MNETIPYLPGLSPVAGKELCARFDGGRLSSDGGVLLFPGIERRLRISDLLASCVTDARDPASTTHTYADMIRARMFAIACGYEYIGPSFLGHGIELTECPRRTTL